MDYRYPKCTINTRCSQFRKYFNRSFATCLTDSLERRFLDSFFRREQENPRHFWHLRDECSVSQSGLEMHLMTRLPPIMIVDEDSTGLM